MKCFIVDSNIIFSAIMYPERAIGRFFLGPITDQVDLVTPSKVLEELLRHRPKMMTLSATTESEITNRQSAVLRNIEIVPDDTLPFEAYLQALLFVRDVDIDDISFVALAGDRDGWLVTGDKTLIRGLTAKGYDRVISFSSMLEMIDNSL